MMGQPDCPPRGVASDGEICSEAAGHSPGDDKVRRECPGCRKRLRIRPEYLGSPVICKRCCLRFVAPAGTSGETDSSLVGGKVRRECPGCRGSLRIRPEYLGSALICKRCGHQFVAPGEPCGSSPGGIPDSGIGPRRAGGDGGRGVDALASGAGPPADWLGDTRAVIEGLAPRDAGGDWRLGHAMAVVAEHASELAAMRQRVAALGADLETVRGRDASVVEDQRRAFADEVAAMLAGERELAGRHLELLRAEVEGLRRQDGELASRGAEARDHSLALEARLVALEESSPRCREQVDLMRGRLSAVEQAGAGWAAIGEQLDFLADQSRSFLRIGADRQEEVRSDLAELRAEQASIRTTLADYQRRQGELETGLGRLEASRAEDRSGFAARCEQWEARLSAEWEEIEALRGQMRQAAADHAARLDRLESHFGRIDVIGMDAAALRRGLESLHLEHETLTAEVLDRFERLRCEIEGLRAGSKSRGPIPSPVAPTPEDVGGHSMPPRLQSASSAPASAPVALRIDYDRLALDLVRDRLAGEGQRPADEPPATLATPSESADVASPAPSHLDIIEYKRLGGLFDSCMRSGRFADATAVGRDLVAYTRDRMGESSLQHAMGLRSLAWSLALTDGPDEARELFDRAAKISKRSPESGWYLHATCLLDLAEFCSGATDGRRAISYCEEAVAVLEAKADAASPLWARVRRCMARAEVPEHRRWAMSAVPVSR